MPLTRLDSNAGSMRVLKDKKQPPPGNAPALLAGALAPVIYSLVYYKYLEHRGQLENGSPNGDRELNGNT